jgi:hypothetical protein
MQPDRRTPSAAYSPADQWRGLYAGRPDKQKMVNTKALAKLMDDFNAMLIALQTCLTLLDEDGYIGDPDYPEVAEALALYERLVGA